MAGRPKQGSNTGLLPSSAAVLDFICLFTHDLKRKQKRWQDGALKYHTFNKRIMVYNDHGHFIGDAHWQAETHLESGDEFELDRGAAIVQVSDCTGQKEQDLTELLDKRARDVERRRVNATSRTSRPGLHAPASPTHNQSAHFQLRHRPLTDIVGAPSRIGRAIISSHSPYEARQTAQRAEQDEDSRSPKRRKKEESPPAKSHHARSLFGATLTLTSMASPHPPRSQVPRDKPNVGLKALLGEGDTGLQPHTLPNKHLDAQAQRPINSEELTTSHISDLPQYPDNMAKAPDAIRSSRKEGMGQNSHAEQTVASADNNTIRTPSLQPAAVRIPNKDLAQNRLTLQDLSPVDGLCVVEKSQPIKPILPSTEDAVNTEEVTKSATENGLSRPGQGPRTKLRIKSRQRRGLLISEKRAAEPNRGKGSKIMAEKGLELSRNPEPEEMVPLPQDLNFSLCQPRTSNVRPKISCQEDEVATVAVTLVTRADEEPATSKRRTRKKVMQYVLSDEELEDAELTPHSKATRDSRHTKSAVPRITKMARKSVKSREIIGFTVPNNKPLQLTPAAIPAIVSVNPTQRSLDAQMGDMKSLTEDSKIQMLPAKSTSVTSVPQQLPDCDLDANPTMRPIPRLSNPATRGRKAAKKEDAAGQLPQTIVQLDPAVPLRIGAPKAPSARITSTLPGFTNANGGAWSKHAEDLLGMTRPKK